MRTPTDAPVSCLTSKRTLGTTNPTCGFAGSARSCPCPSSIAPRRKGTRKRKLGDAIRSRHPPSRVPPGPVLWSEKSPSTCGSVNSIGVPVDPWLDPNPPVLGLSARVRVRSWSKVQTSHVPSASGGGSVGPVVLRSWRRGRSASSAPEFWTGAGRSSHIDIWRPPGAHEHDGAGWWGWFRGYARGWGWRVGLGNAGAGRRARPVPRAARCSGPRRAGGPVIRPASRAPPGGGRRRAAVRGGWVPRAGDQRAGRSAARAQHTSPGRRGIGESGSTASSTRRLI